MIEALKENYQGSGYTSAKLDTSGKAKWTYGRYEIKAQLPEGQGLWPAIWMMPEDMGMYGTWPASGEIDIMEALGHEPSTIHGTLHYGVEHASSGQSYTLPGGQTFTSGFHTYAVEWEPGELRFYVDDMLYAVQNDWFAYNYENPDVYTYPAPFDRDFYMQLNVAVGGVWPGNPDASTVFPQKMLVDYVRVYQLDEEKYRKVPGQRPGPRDLSGITGTGKAPTADGNYVYNGAFDQNAPDVEGIPGTANSDYWTLNNGTGFGAQATAAYDNGAMRVDISNGGGATYAVQLIQKPIPIEMGKSYKISVDARASANRNIEVKTSQGGEGGWTDYGKGNMAVTTETKTYSYTFRMLSNTHHTARLEINLGGSTGSVWIDNVRFEEVTDNTVVERPPLANGNYIYNGTFELGASYMGFWTFEKDADAAATSKVNPHSGLREFHAAIDNGGNSESSVRLKQRGLHLVKDNWYKIQFKARAKSARSIDVRIAGESARFALTSNDGAYSYIFKMNGNSDLNGELQFLLGGDGADVYIDDVEMKQYFPPLSTMLRGEDFETTEGVTMKPKTAGGNYVAFDDESDFIESGIEIVETGEYIVSYKVSAVAGGKSIGVELDGGAKRLLAVPNTHGYERWSVVTERVQLTAGSHTWKLTGKGVNLDWIELAPDLISNDAMDTVTDPWVLWVGTEDWAGFAAGSMAIDSGEMKIDIQNQGNQFWSIQFNQMGISLKQGKNYRLSFDARSTVNRQIRVSLEQDGGSPQYLLKTLDLGNGMTRYSYDFAMNQISQENAKLNFVLGNVSGIVGAHQVYLDNVILSETGEVVPELGGGTLANLALNQTATASSGNAALAFDGNLATRWESAQSDPQSIQVDLGSAQEIDYVKLNWEGAYGKAYSIDVSTNGSDWTTVFLTSGGNGGLDEIRFHPVQARYVKVNGTARGTNYGYSLFEFAVYAHDAGYIVEPSAPPALVADSTDAIIKHDTEIAFADNEQWRNSITSLSLNGTPLVNGMDYWIVQGKIQLKGTATPTAGDYEIRIQAIRYDDATVTQSISPIPPTVDLAVGKPATASSGDAASAFDGNDGTRWISDVSDPQWIRVDLGDVYDIGRVLLKWEGAYGKTYSVETSVNGTDWTEVYATNIGDGGVDTFNFASAHARYVRLTGTERGTIYSYSLWSFEVYPYDPSGLMTPPALIADTTNNIVGEGVEIGFSDDPAWRTAISDILIDNVSVIGSVYANVGRIEIPALLIPEAKDYDIQVVATGYSQASVVQTVSAINLALSPGVTASASSGDASMAIDGNSVSRWESEHKLDPQWIMVDLKSSKTIQRVIIDWEGARASTYKVEVSVDGTGWTEVYTTTSGSGAKDILTFSPVSGQYLRMTGTVRALPYGYSIYEIAIY